MVKWSKDIQKKYMKEYNKKRSIVSKSIIYNCKKCNIEFTGHKRYYCSPSCRPKERQKLYYKNNKEKYMKYAKEYYYSHKNEIRATDKRHHFKRAYITTQRGAGRRNIPFSLEKPLFYVWYIKNYPLGCCYCGVTYNKDVYSLRASIDRMDNNKGYTHNNICMCCVYCNTTKNGLLSYDDMLKVGELISNRRFLATC